MIDRLVDCPVLVTVLSALWDARNLQGPRPRNGENLPAFGTGFSYAKVRLAEARKAQSSLPLSLKILRPENHVR